MMNRKMLRQAQELQKQMVKMQEELESATVEASVGGGVVKVVVSGKMKIESLTIDPEAVTPDDVEMLQDALAFPGGLIGVTSGLLEQVETENELAFVLGHELGHFRNRDHLRSLGRGLVLGLLLTVATGSGGSSQLLQFAPMLAERSFAREQERESDSFGLELVYREYGHVAAADDFFRRIAEPGSPLARQLEGYVSTHPLSETRVADLWALARQQGWPRRGEPLPFSY